MSYKLPYQELHESRRRNASGLLAAWQRLPAAKEGMLEGSGISEADFAGAVVRLNAGEDAATVLDERFVQAFTISGDGEDCRRQSAAYAAVGVTELALTFSGSRPTVDMSFMAEAMTG